MIFILIDLGGLDEIQRPKEGPHQYTPDVIFGPKLK